jgi:exonuclease VII small subunit
MKLANVRLKMDKVGSNVEIKHVSPAEAILLVSDHHANAGGSPIEQIVVLDDNAEQPQIDILEADVERLEKQITDLDTSEAAFDVKERRATYLRDRLTSVKERLARLLALQTRRKFTPTQEVNRLRAKYGAGRTDKAFPGAIPQIPDDFPEAVEAGLKIKTTSDRLFTVGDSGE